jgi:hypothetical protein
MPVASGPTCAKIPHRQSDFKRVFIFLGLIGETRAPPSRQQNDIQIGDILRSQEEWLD